MGSSEVLKQLNQITPVIAVLGNNDKGSWAEELSVREIVKVGKVNIYMLHDLKELNLNPSEKGFQVVVSGHSHKPSVEERLARSALRKSG